MRIKRLIVASFVAALLAVGIAGPASAKKVQDVDGLVNVVIGDIQIKNVAVTDAVDAVVLACPNVDVDVAAIIAAIDEGTMRQTTFCEAETGGEVRVRNN